MFWRRRKGGDEPPKPAGGNAYDGLRRQILELTPEAAGIDAREGRTVYAAVMDWPVAGAVATVVALADGTASLYISTGGGVIGGGAHPAVAQAARTFILSLENYLPAMVDDPDGALPPAGMTDLRALTTSGRRTVRAPTADLGEFRHPLANAFHAGQNLLGALRQLAESQPNRPAPPPK